MNSNAILKIEPESEVKNYVIEFKNILSLIL